MLMSLPNIRHRKILLSFAFSIDHCSSRLYRLQTIIHTRNNISLSILQFRNEHVLLHSIAITNKFTFHWILILRANHLSIRSQCIVSKSHQTYILIFLFPVYLQILFSIKRPFVFEQQVNETEYCNIVCSVIVNYLWSKASE